jgi:hypothetical protein
MSTTTGFRPDEDEFEPTPTSAVEEVTPTSPETDQARALEVETLEALVDGDRAEGDGTAPARRRAARAPRRRFRLPRNARLVRMVLVLLALEVVLSSFGVLPGNGWPLSLLDDHAATAVARPAGSIGPTGATT